MARLVVFNSVSLDGYFTDANGDMSWAHNPKKDPEWEAFIAGNATGSGTLLFGRITYELMASFWPTPMGANAYPEVAVGMNKAKKIVFSRKMNSAEWNNTRVVQSDLVGEVRKLKSEPGHVLAILGSGSIVSQLTQEGLIDEYQVAIAPVVIGSGRTMFEGVKKKLSLKLTRSKEFKNGNVLLHYEPTA
jgi:dihydrofolate reductase